MERELEKISNMGCNENWLKLLIKAFLRIFFGGRKILKKICEKSNPGHFNDVFRGTNINMDLV